MTATIKINVHALSNSDALGYRGQKAVADAVVEGSDYLIVGGHMVRLLLHAFPTPEATPRSTTDADAAVGSVEVVGPFVRNLVEKDFTKKGGNLFYRDLGKDQRIEINLLLSREGHRMGLQTLSVEGVGQVDTLPELRFAMMTPVLTLDVVADLGGGEQIEYQTRVPNVEAAVVLKAHGWNDRKKEKDLADLHSLLEMREAHPDIPWELNKSGLEGFRKDTAVILKDIAGKITRKRPGFEVPNYLDVFRFAGLVAKHIA